MTPQVEMEPAQVGPSHLEDTKDLPVSRVAEEEAERSVSYFN
jgi:hypothetical protein